MPYDQINQGVAACKAAEEGLFFYPFSGYAGKKQFARGSFVGLDLSHDTFHMARAVMEDVAFQIADMLDDFPVKPGKDGLILAGGASKSPVWSQIVADITELPVQIPATADLACVGAAIMAGVGSGVFATMEEGYRALAVKNQVITPNPQQAAIYARLCKTYAQTAQHLTKLYNL